MRPQHLLELIDIDGPVLVQIKAIEDIAELKTFRELNLD